MKILSFMFGMICWVAMLLPLKADPPPTYDKIPLPPGPILKRPSGFSQWQITYAYNPASSASSSMEKASASLADPHSPKLITFIQTKPLWQVIIIDTSDQKTESLFDGINRFEIGPKSSDPIVITSQPGVHTHSYYDHGADFPDVDWVSPETYVGKQKDSNLWVFQQPAPGDAWVWIDFSTHFPVRWQNGRETRTFQFLAEPTEPISLPPDIAKISQALKKLEARNRAMPPHL